MLLSPNLAGDKRHITPSTHGEYILRELMELIKIELRKLWRGGFYIHSRTYVLKKNKAYSIINR
ncbi:MAG: hypothetical protein ACI9UV_000460 [Algoriphagus sp.]|jgi:hypothetical protein